MYTELLARAVDALRKGEVPDLEKPLHAGAEINVHVPALLPDDYIPDVHLRLMLYKRIASAANEDALRDLQVELIDRFGLLPDAAKHLMRNAALKLAATRLGITKIDAAARGGYIDFGSDAAVDPVALVQLVQKESQVYKLQGAQRLQFRCSLDAVDRRYQFVETVLAQLGPMPGAARALAG